MDTYILNTKRVSVLWLLYVLSNTWATFVFKFMKKLIKAEFKKALLIKKAWIYRMILSVLTAKYEKGKEYLR